MPKRRINLCITDERWQQLKAYAASHHISASVAVDQALDVILSNEEEKRQARMKAVEEIFKLNLGDMGSPEDLEAELEEAHAPGGEVADWWGDECTS